MKLTRAEDQNFISFFLATHPTYDPGWVQTNIGHITLTQEFGDGLWVMRRLVREQAKLKGLTLPRYSLDTIATHFRELRVSGEPIKFIAKRTKSLLFRDEQDLKLLNEELERVLVWQPWATNPDCFYFGLAGTYYLIKDVQS